MLRAMADRYRALPDMLRLPVRAGEVLVKSPLGGRPELVSADDVQLLARAERFATLHEHASRVPATAGSAAAGIASAARRLEALAARGLLVSERELCAALCAVGVARETQPSIRTVGIPTGTELAVGAIESLRRGSARELEIVIAHDARDDGEEAALLARLAGLEGLRYLGPRERRAYATRVAERAGVAADLVSWALTREHPDLWGAGALRNALLLDTVGDLSLQIDDDVRCELGTPAGAEPGLSLTSAPVMELWFPEPGHDGDSLVALAPGDVAAAHEALLGHSLASCVADAGAIEVGEASGSFLREVLAGRGRVRCTQMGLCGDSATGSLGHYLLLDGAARERLLASEATYAHAFASRQVLRATRRRAITDGASLMSYAIGLDGRSLLPPFMPEGRNGDGVFGYVLRHCFRDGYCAFLPEVVLHRPGPRFSSMAALLDELRHIDQNDLLCRIIAASGLVSRGDEPALEGLGAHLERLAALRLADLEEMVRTLVLRTRSRDMAMLAHLLHKHRREPDYWARDVERLLDRLRAAAVEDGHALPRDRMRAHGEEAGRRAFAVSLRRYGQLLSVWPAVDRAARELRAEGTRASRPLSGGVPSAAARL